MALIVSEQSDWPAMITVAVIDDDPSIRRSLTRLLAASCYGARVFASAQEFLDCSDCDGVSCIISDLRMPGMNGLDLQQALRAKLPDVSILFISGHGSIPASVEAMKAGAVDFLVKPVSQKLLTDAIERAATRTQERKARSNEKGDLEQRYYTLTVREREVFALVAAGLLNKQVAAELGVALKTIKQHRGRVMDKMAADSFADLVRMAETLGLHSDVDLIRAKGRAASA